MMNHERLTIVDPEAPDTPLAVIERTNQLKITFVDESVRRDTERWLREGFVTWSGVPPEAEVKSVRPSDPAFLSRLAKHLSKSLRLKTQLELFQSGFLTVSFNPPPAIAEIGANKTGGSSLRNEIRTESASALYFMAMTASGVRSNA